MAAREEILAAAAALAWAYRPAMEEMADSAVVAEEQQC